MKNKFRVWCKDYNEWEKDYCFLSQDGVVHQMVLCARVRAIRPENHIVQFYIGLDDIHGKPIYEGDIVKYESWDRNGEQPITARTDLGEVFFEEGIFYFGRGVWFAANDANFSERTLEVVGNVFENPELLKK